MRIVVTGRGGQVVRSLLERASDRSGLTIVPLGRPQLDLAMPASIETAIAGAEPDLVISAAAYTAVDRAEDEPDLAFAVNAVGAGLVAKAAAGIGVPVIHLSTDYVFNGESEGAYSEDDRPAPRGVYGASKLAGEKAVAEANPRHLILRTAWAYSPFGTNFVKTMLRLAADRDEISVVSDQWGNPTSALDLADGILQAAGVIEHANDVGGYGIYHLVGSGETNWSGFARHVLEASQGFGGPHARVKDISTADYRARAPRPANSRLSTAKFTAAFGWSAPDWQQSCVQVVRRLIEDKAKETREK
jgi:dTDP-4-dehydrorhamnose reductase